MKEEMKRYTYIQKLGNHKHLIQDDYIAANYSNKVSTKIAKEVTDEEIGIKLNDLKLSIISTYPDYLKKK